jgi:hypothetical protein
MLGRSKTAMPTQKNLYNDDARYEATTKIHSKTQQTIRTSLLCYETLKQAMRIALLGLRFGEERLLK